MSRPPPMIARETATPEPDHARPEGLSVGRHSPSLATRGCGGASRDRHAGDLPANCHRRRGRNDPVAPPFVLATVRDVDLDRLGFRSLRERYVKHTILVRGFDRGAAYIARKP